MWQFIFRSTKFRISLWGFELQWDCEYGINKRTGWTVAYDGSFAVSHLEPSLIVALLKAYKYWFVPYKPKPHKE